MSMNKDYSLHLNVTQDIGHGITVIFICFIAIVIFALLDMSTGIRASKATKKDIESYMLRKTLTKILDYYHFLIAGIVVDVLGLSFEFYNIPFGAILVTLGVACIELRSMKENFNRAKSSAAEIPDMIERIKRASSDPEAIELFEEIRKFGDKKVRYDKRYEK